jgi:nitrite reductase (NADH) large subunit
MQVTVVHLMPTLMERQLDEAAGWLLKSELERRGQKILTGRDTAEIIGRTAKLPAVRLKDGRRNSGGHRGHGRRHPPVDQAGQEAGLAVERGIVVDDHMVTSDPRCAGGGRMRPASRPSLWPCRAAVGHVPRAGRWPPAARRIRL